MKRISTLLLIQGLYTSVTAVWPIVHIRSFMEVTGYKEDIWLVKTVSAVLLSVAACFLFASHSTTLNTPVYILAITSAIALAVIDFYYSMHDVISNIYQLDGMLQVMFFICWAIILVRMYDGRKTGSIKA